jgi:peptidoglycan/LPS O-acetylase OafA/YrhL
VPNVTMSKTRASTNRWSPTFIPEIQALRAIAVSLVVWYHLSPETLPGGFVGVDVFFVISGFLITGHIAREISEKRFSLSAFYARRIRRLLPASFLVLGVSLAATILFVPRLYWKPFAQEVAASALYSENWLLARNAVDYLAAENVASPVQHFWSLAVEEQFYLVWPVVMLLLFALARKNMRIVAGLISLVFFASLAVSIVLTETNPSAAYFITPTRVWELAAGGLVALIPTARVITLRKLPIAFLGSAGLALIAMSAGFLTTETPYPGIAAALPVFGTILVIVSSIGVATRFRTVMRNGVFDFVGKISYSVYLWHWPIIIFLPFLMPEVSGWNASMIVLALTLGLAYLSWRYIEIAAQRARIWNAPRSKRPFGFAAVCSLTLVLASSGIAIGIDAHVNRIAEAVTQADHSSCFGAAARDRVSMCTDPFDPSPISDPVFAAVDLGVGVVVGPCELGAGTIPLRPCEYGNIDNPERTIALFGDSHAGQLIESLAPVVEANNWKLVTYIKAACPGIGAADPSVDPQCADWGDNARALIRADSSIDDVIVANATSKYFGPLAGLLDKDQAEGDLAALQQSGKRVFLVRDPPGSIRQTDSSEAFNVNACLAVNPHNASACAVDRDRLITDDVIVRLAHDLNGVHILDLSDSFCDLEYCYPVVGGVAVYSDGGHLSKTFARTLAPIFSQLIAAAD